MPDSFFHSDKKRKRPSRAGPSSGRPSRGGGRPITKQRPTDRDEDISSASDAGAGDFDTMDFRAGREDGPLSDGEIIDENETAAEKRVRLAKSYLAKVKQDLEAAQVDGDYDAAEIDRELIASRLQKDVAESQGRIHTYLGSRVQDLRSRFITIPSHLPTSIAVTPHDMYVSTKRGSIFRYSLPSLGKMGQPFGQVTPSPKNTLSDRNGHHGEILCLAASEDGKWLVSGGRDKIVGVWNVEGESAKWLVGLRGHKDAITSISLPPLDNPTHHILTASLSRHLALASLSTLSVIDTFFGHQDSITSVSALKPTAAVTAGSRDRTCRWWKVEEEVQLVLRGGGRTFEGLSGVAPEPRKERLGGGWEEEKDEDIEKRKELEKKGKTRGREFAEGSIDCVCMLDDQHFISGGDSGSISLWHTGKKKPIFTRAFAHGLNDLTDGSNIQSPRWITSLAGLRGTDLFVSGSWDGQIRLWAVDSHLRSFAPANHHTIPIPGFVNALQILSVSSSSINSSSWRRDDVLSGTELNAATSTSETVHKDSLLPKQEIILVAAVGREPRLGRWMSQKAGVKNGALFVHIRTN